MNPAATLSTNTTFPPSLASTGLNLLPAIHRTSLCLHLIEWNRISCATRRPAQPEARLFLILNNLSFRKVKNQCHAMEEGGLVYEGKWENGMKHGQACGWALKT
jgi:hypothetical protein